MNRSVARKLESLRRELEAMLFERRTPEYMGPGAAQFALDTVRKIRALEAEPVSFRAPLPPEEAIMRDPERYGRALERTLADLKDVLRSITDYNWSRQR